MPSFPLLCHVCTSAPLKSNFFQERILILPRLSQSLMCTSLIFVVVFLGAKGNVHVYEVSSVHLIFCLKQYPSQNPELANWLASRLLGVFLSLSPPSPPVLRLWVLEIGTQDLMLT